MVSLSPIITKCCWSMRGKERRFPHALSFLGCRRGGQFSSQSFIEGRRVREGQKPTEGPKTGPNRDRRSCKMEGPVQFLSGPFQYFGLGPNKSLLSPQFSFPLSAPTSVIPPSGLSSILIRAHLCLSSKLFFLSTSRLIFRYVFHFRNFFVSV